MLLCMYTYFSAGHDVDPTRTMHTTVLMRLSQERSFWVKWADARATDDELSTHANSFVTLFRRIVFGFALMCGTLFIYDDAV